MLLVSLVVVTHSAHSQSQPQRRGPPAQQGPRIDVEAVLYSQRRLIDEALSGILPSEKAQPNTYFVGFAAWSEQDVFIREIAQARDIVDERLGTWSRSLLLVNHVTALDEVPLATVTNLDIVLGRLAKIMDVEKDTLLLFMTSHGIENLFGVRFPGFPLNDLTPQRLAQILDRSGIRNRIIIISACHSGSFIPALRTSTTLVMTAARGDHTSFGCSNENDWTFFGDALFNHALRATTSMPAAFAKASELVAGWEAREKFTPSEPQIFIGDGIGPIIDRLAAQPSTRPSGLTDGRASNARAP